MEFVIPRSKLSCLSLYDNIVFVMCKSRNYKKMRDIIAFILSIQYMQIFYFPSSGSEKTQAKVR